jgi:hypothetical protein
MVEALINLPALNCETVIEPFAQESLRHAGQNGQIILLSLDQTDLGDRMAVLMLTVRIGDRSLPLLWLAEAGAANIGFAQQKAILDKVQEWIPNGAAVMAAGRSLLPHGGTFSMAQGPELALPFTPKRQLASGYRRGR